MAGSIQTISGHCEGRRQWSLEWLSRPLRCPVAIFPFPAALRPGETEDRHVTSSAKMLLAMTAISVFCLTLKGRLFFPTNSRHCEGQRRWSLEWINWLSAVPWQSSLSRQAPPGGNGRSPRHIFDQDAPRDDGYCCILASFKGPTFSFHQ
jgi:hypothetical protein